jgi:hypothetical protein
MLSWRPQLSTAVDTTMDPMLVEAAIQGSLTDRRSASDSGHVAVTTTGMVDTSPTDIVLASDDDGNV